jgi:hypothetical protein
LPAWTAPALTTSQNESPALAWVITSMRKCPFDADPAFDDFVLVSLELLSPLPVLHAATPNASATTPRANPRRIFMCFLLVRR